MPRPTDWLRSRTMDSSPRATPSELSGRRPPAPDGPAELLLGKQELLHALEQAAAELDIECLAVLPIGGRQTVSPDEVRHLYRQVLDRGVRMNILYPARARADAGILGFARWSSALGASVRTTDAPLPAVLIFDRSSVLLPQDQRNRARGSVRLLDRAVVSALCLVFDEAWAAAVPLGDTAADPEPDPLTRTEHELLRLLARGYTDAAAARQLGMSVRSVRRLIAALLTRLHAVSRFEAGGKAAQRGWLSRSVQWPDSNG